MMSEYLLSNTPLALLFAHLDLLKLDCLNCWSTNGNDWGDLIHANVNTDSFLETKPILRNTFNKYLGKSHLLLFLLLFLVDLKQKGRTTGRKDNREVWNRVPLWLCFINICYNPLPEWSFVWGIRQQMFGLTWSLLWQQVLLPCCVTRC